MEIAGVRKPPSITGGGVLYFTTTNLRITPSDAQYEVRLGRYARGKEKAA